MDRDVADRTETEEDMLTLDVSDDALEPQLLAKEKRLLGHIAPTFGTTAGGPSKH
jgi:hypothetical protein